MPLEIPVAAWADEIRRALDASETGRIGWAPAMDVLETAAGVEIRLDVAGVPREALRVTLRAGTLNIAGSRAHTCRPNAAFLLAERACGRFLRSVPLALAFDAAAITATLSQGELRIIVPRIEERRGREIEIPVVAS